MYWQVRTKKKELHTAEARRRAQDQMLINDDGELLPLHSDLSASSAGALKYRLGAGVTSYLHILWYGFIGFTLAGVAAIPTLYRNLNGEVLTALGCAPCSGAVALRHRPLRRRPAPSPCAGTAVEMPPNL